MDLMIGGDRDYGWNLLGERQSLERIIEGHVWLYM